MVESKSFTPSCSVVICTRNRPAQLDQCLEAASRLTYPKFDVLVVDNAPTDTRSRDVASRWGVRYVIEPEPGLSRARNRGARACDSEILAYLDDDAVPEPEWLSELAQEFKEPLVMAVAGRVLAQSVETEAERLCASIGCSDIGSQERRVVDRHVPSWFEIANFGGIGIGANMAFRRSAFDVWPGFHHRLDSGVLLDGGGESHAFFSLIDRGYRVVYTPHAVVHHPLPRTMEYFRARYLKDMTDATAYITLLFFEEPRYGRKIIKYVVEAMRGTCRTWRAHAISPLPREVFPRWRVMLAYLSGPPLYLWSRLACGLWMGRDLDAWRIRDLQKGGN